ncbi:ATP-binding protein (plasmid) [Klebsiella pneumoniae]|uniref:ATP-binding protein n=1 Tax=Klebsiella pneumoniae TaxID=573 RepID=UPI001FABA920|nr:ATP-binding protein [Klebsiella pneumoniae]MCI8108411.1 hypothetical protein [Klebsiella pneumoniae]
MEQLSFNEERLNFTTAAATIVIESVKHPALVLVIGRPGSGKSTLAEAACRNGCFEMIDVQTTRPKDYKTILPKILGTDKHLIIDGLDLNVQESEMVLNTLRSQQEQGKGAIVTSMFCGDSPITRLFTAMFWIENESPRIDGHIRFKRILSIDEYDPRGMNYSRSLATQTSISDVKPTEPTPTAPLRNTRRKNKLQVEQKVLADAIIAAGLKTGLISSPDELTFDSHDLEVIADTIKSAALDAGVISTSTDLTVDELVRIVETMADASHPGNSKVTTN